MILKDTWYAVQVRARAEQRVASLLEEKGYEKFVPLERSYCARSRRVVESKPLFPGYVFCRVSASSTGRIVTTPRVIRIVSAGNVPIGVNHVEIEALQRMAQACSSLEPYPFLQIGQQVRIAAGPLAGVEGMLARFANGDRLVVSISILQRAVAAEIPSDSVVYTSPP